MWTRRRKIEDGDTEEFAAEKAFHNSILLDRYPYFFKYRYSKCRKAYKDYTDRTGITCKQRFRMTIEELEALPEKTDEQNEFLANYYRFMPVIISNSPMNILCRRIERLASEVLKRSKTDEFDYSILKFADVEYSKEEYKLVIKHLKKFIQARREIAADTEQSKDSNQYASMNEYTEMKLLTLLPDLRVTINIIVDYFYRDNPTKSRDLLWGVFGRYIIDNISDGTITLPIADSNGDIEYMGERYKLVKFKTR